MCTCVCMSGCGCAQHRGACSQGSTGWAGSTSKADWGVGSRAGSAAGLGKWPWRNKAGPSQLAFPGAEVPRQVKVLPNLNSPHGKLD